MLLFPAFLVLCLLHTLGVLIYLVLSLQVSMLAGVVFTVMLICSQENCWTGLLLLVILPFTIVAGICIGVRNIFCVETVGSIQRCYQSAGQLFELLLLW